MGGIGGLGPALEDQPAKLLASLIPPEIIGQLGVILPVGSEEEGLLGDHDVVADLVEVLVHGYSSITFD